MESGRTGRGSLYLSIVRDMCKAPESLRPDVGYSGCDGVLSVPVTASFAVFAMREPA